MQFADASYVEFWFIIVSEFVGDILWQVCGDLPSPPVHGHHELESVLHPGHHLLGMWICPGPGPSNSLVKITLLWAPEGEPLPLWHSLCPQIGLWWHLDQWNAPLCWWRSDLSWASCPGAGLLYAHPQGHPEDPVKGGPQESLLHLLLPPLCGGFYFHIAMVVYMVPDNSQREHLKILFLFYTLFNPLLNPLVYSVRNAQVKAAFHRVLQKKRTVWGRVQFWFSAFFPPWDVIAGMKNLMHDFMMTVTQKEHWYDGRIWIPKPLFFHGYENI